MSDLPIIQVQYRSVYGNRLLYPMNAAAQLFTQILGTKTVCPRKLELLRDMGHKVEFVAGGV